MHKALLACLCLLVSGCIQTTDDEPTDATNYSESTCTQNGEQVDCSKPSEFVELGQTASQSFELQPGQTFTFRVEFGGGDMDLLLRDMVGASVGQLEVDGPGSCKASNGSGNLNVQTGIFIQDRTVSCGTLAHSHYAITFAATGIVQGTVHLENAVLSQ